VGTAGREEGTAGREEGTAGKEAGKEAGTVDREVDTAGREVGTADREVDMAGREVDMAGMGWDMAAVGDLSQYAACFSEGFAFRRLSLTWTMRFHSPPVISARRSNLHFFSHTQVHVGFFLLPR
jgi:hypothetical protein